jgi:hypothetical protein
MTKPRRPLVLTPLKAAARTSSTAKKAPGLPTKKAAKAVVAVAAAKATDKPKRVRGEFTMPEADHALIATLKARCKHQGRPVKKNELLRAGLRALNAMGSEGLKAAIAALGPAKGVKGP